MAQAGSDAVVDFDRAPPPAAAGEATSHGTAASARRQELEDDEELARQLTEQLRLMSPSEAPGGQPPVKSSLAEGLAPASTMAYLAAELQNYGVEYHAFD